MASLPNTKLQHNWIISILLTMSHQALTPTQQTHAATHPSIGQAQQALSQALNHPTAATPSTSTGAALTTVVAFFIGIVHLLINWVEAWMKAVTQCPDHLEKALRLVEQFKQV